MKEPNSWEGKAAYSAKKAAVLSQSPEIHHLTQINLRKSLRNLMSLKACLWKCLMSNQLSRFT
jgi:hypothetical protein